MGSVNLLYFIIKFTKHLLYNKILIKLKFYNNLKTKYLKWYVLIFWNFAYMFTCENLFNFPLL